MQKACQSYIPRVILSHTYFRLASSFPMAWHGRQRRWVCARYHCFSLKTASLTQGGFTFVVVVFFFFSPGRRSTTRITTSSRTPATVGSTRKAARNCLTAFSFFFFSLSFLFFPPWQGSRMTLVVCSRAIALFKFQFSRVTLFSLPLLFRFLLLFPVFHRPQQPARQQLVHQPGRVHAHLRASARLRRRLFQQHLHHDQGQAIRKKKKKIEKGKKEKKKERKKRRKKRKEGSNESYSILFHVVQDGEYASFSASSCKT